MISTVRLGLLIGAIAVLSACDSFMAAGEVGQVDAAALDPSAYQYKGAADPLLSVPASERAGGLADRFDQVQGRQ